jgi:hypothetical protein
MRCAHDALSDKGFLMDNFDPGVRAAFLERLLKATTSKAIQWVSGGREFWYYVDVPPFACAIESADVDDAPPYDFHLYRNVDDEHSEEIDIWRWDRSGGPLNEYLRGLYGAARAQALDLVDLADDVFGALAKLDGGPAEVSRIDLPNEMPF